MSRQEEGLTCGSCACYFKGYCVGDVVDGEPTEFDKPACIHHEELEEDSKDEQQ